MWIAILCSLILLLLTRFLWRRWRYDLHKVLTPPGLPVLGHTLDFVYGDALRDIQNWIGNGLKHLSYPKLMRFDLAGEPWLVVTDDQFFKTVVLSARNPFPQVVEDGGLVLPMIGDNPQAKSMLLHPGVSPYVKAVRRIYAAAFQSHNLKTAAPKLQDVMNNMISVIESKRKEGPVEIQRLFVSMTLDAIGLVAFEMNLGGLDKSRELLDLILAAGYIAREEFLSPIKRMYNKLFPQSNKGQERHATIGKLTEEWKRIVDEIRARGDAASSKETIWYGLKHLANPETGKRAAYDLLLAETAVVVVGGMDSTGHQLGWIFALLASRPDVVENVLEELKQHGFFGKGSCDVQYEDLAKLTYLTAVIKEGMRLACIVPTSFSRRTPKDMTILGYRIPKGIRILQVGNRAFYVDTDWDDPESFKPERWLTNDEICSKWNMMFSTGPRDCPGQKLAMLEMRLAIIALLKKYRLSLVGSYGDLANNVKSGLALEAKDGIWLNFDPIEAA